jgi:hypothetical protein
MTDITTPRVRYAVAAFLSQKFGDLPFDHQGHAKTTGAGVNTHSAPSRGIEPAPVANDPRKTATSPKNASPKIKEAGDKILLSLSLIIELMYFNNGDCTRKGVKPGAFPYGILFS